MLKTVCSSKVSSPQELVGDLQHTHTHTHNRNNYTTSLWAQVHLGVLYRGSSIIIFVQTITNCLYVYIGVNCWLTCDLPTAVWTVPGLPLSPPLSPSILGSLSSVLPLLSLPLCQDSRRVRENVRIFSGDSPTSLSTHLPSEWSVRLSQTCPTALLCWAAAFVETHCPQLLTETELWTSMEDLQSELHQDKWDF